MTTEQALQSKITVEGIEYYNIKTFAQLSKRSEQAVRKLVNVGNRLGKLKVLRISRSLLIPVTELSTFRFCISGTSRVVVRFDEKATERTEFI